MNPWLIYPPWQHFSSLFREAVTAKEEPNEFIRYHHFTSALYFGISFVESLLNRKRRELLEKQLLSEEEIHSVLRKGGFSEKLLNWPSLICGKDIEVPEALATVLVDFNEIRCDLTHTKSRGHDIYERLEKLDMDEFVGAVAEYAVTVHMGLNERYPYWIFGWNYVAGSPTSPSPFLINDQQFVHSLAGLGVRMNAFDANWSNSWRNAHMSDVAGYRRIKLLLGRLPEHEPFDSRFPFAPRLCKRWWDSKIVAQKIPAAPSPMPFLAGTVAIAVKWITPIFPSKSQQ